MGAYAAQSLSLHQYGFKYILPHGLDVLFHDDFAVEFAALAESLQDELLAHALLLRDFGPGLGRPTADTLKGSKHTNMKELRFAWTGEVWRSRLIPRAKQFCWSAATRAAQINEGSISD